MQQLKENLFDNRYQIASLRKSENWDYEQIMKVCKSLKNSKVATENTPFFGKNGNNKYLQE